MPAATACRTPTKVALRLLRQLALSPQVHTTASCKDTYHQCKRRHTVATQRKGASDGNQKLSPTDGPPSHASPETNSRRPAQPQSWNIRTRIDGSIRTARLEATRRFDDPVKDVAEQHQKLGNHGIRAALRRIREQDIVPPTEGTLAVHFWEALAGQQDLHDEVVDFAVELFRREQIKYTRLWWRILRTNFDAHSPNTVELYNRMHAGGLVAHDGLSRLAESMKPDEAKLACFRQLLLETKETKVYNSLIKTLLKHGLHDEAKEWHSFLLEQGNKPSKQMLQHPFVREMGYSAVLTREAMSLILGDVHGVKPVTMSDTLCARFFATTPFPIDIVIMGLAAVGVTELGPLALRRLASRCDSSQELLEKLQRIKDTGIAIQDNVFASAVQRLAREGRDELLRSMLKSDQHVEAMANKRIQRKLLKEHLEKGDLITARWTLYILVHCHGETGHHNWNSLVRLNAEKSDWHTLTRIMDDVLANNVQIFPYTIFKLLHSRLRPRRRNSRPVLLPGAPDELLYITNWMRALVNNGWIPPPRLWTELIKRFGMTGRWADLSNHLVWLVQRYSPSTLVESPNGSTPEEAFLRKNLKRLVVRKAVERTYHASDPRHPLRQLVPPELQRAIVEWGFRKGFNSLENHFRLYFERDAKANGLTTYAFRNDGQFQALSRRIARALPEPDILPLRGLTLLRQLQDHGVHIDVQIVRRAVTNRLWQLYGPQGSSKVKANRRARMINPWTIEEMLLGIGRITGGNRQQGDGHAAQASTFITEQATSWEVNSGKVNSAAGTPEKEPVVQLPNSIAVVGGDALLESSISGGRSTAIAQVDSSGHELGDLVDSSTATILREIYTANRIRRDDPLTHRPLESTSFVSAGPLDLSQRGELQRRVRLAISVFGLDRSTHGRSPFRRGFRETMTAPMYVELVRLWAHKRLKRKLGISGALARPAKGAPYRYGGAWKRSAQRRGLLPDGTGVSKETQATSTISGSTELERSSRLQS